MTYSLLTIVAAVGFAGLSLVWLTVSMRRDQRRKRLSRFETLMRLRQIRAYDSERAA